MRNAGSEAADRLVAALGDLLSREAVEARAGAGSRVRSIQERISPVVESLSKLAKESPNPRLAGALERLVEKRRQNRLVMQAALNSLRRDIEDRTKALERLRYVGPAYRPRNLVASRLNAST